MAGGSVTGGAGGSVCCVCEGWVVVSGGVGLGVVVGAGFVGVGFVGAGLVEAVGTVQMSLYAEDQRRDKWERIDRAVDHLRQRYGYMSVRRALLDTDPRLGHINVRDDHTVHPVGYFGG